MTYVVARQLCSNETKLILSLLFRKELDLSVLTERRVLCPYGLHGGSPGARGVNSLVNILFSKVKWSLNFKNNKKGIVLKFFFTFPLPTLDDLGGVININK